MPKRISKQRVNSRRGTANSRYLRARSRALRPQGPYRPSRPPRPSRDLGLRVYWLVVFLILLLFSLGQIWKADEVTRLRTQIDSLRSQQQLLEERWLTLQLKADEISSYARIEPLAREKLGMRPASQPPTVITPLGSEFVAYRQRLSDQGRQETQ